MVVGKRDIALCRQLKQGGFSNATIQVSMEFHFGKLFDAVNIKDAAHGC